MPCRVASHLALMRSKSAPPPVKELKRSERRKASGGPSTRSTFLTTDRWRTEPHQQSWKHGRPTRAGRACRRMVVRRRLRHEDYLDILSFFIIMPSSFFVLSLDMESFFII